MMKAGSLCGLVLLGVAGCSQTTGPGGVPETFMNLPLVLVEEFDQPCPEKWEPTDPAAWRFTRDGERTVYGMVARSNYRPRYRSPEGISLLKDVHVSDFVLDVWWRSMTRNYAHRDMCVFFGYQDPAHFYYVHFGLKSDESSNTIHIVNNAPRAPIVKTRADGTPWTEGYHHARVVREAESGLIEAYFDEMSTPAMTAQDTTFQWGRIGLGSFDDTGYIDRLVLWGRKVTPPKSTVQGIRPVEHLAKR